MGKISAKDKAEALETLRKHLRPGVTVYTILRHRARSGMMRVVDVYAIDGGEPLRLSWSAAVATGYTYSRKHEGVAVQGCGMDVGFEVVYALGRALFPDGVPCIGPDCRSNDHSNGDRDYTPGKIHGDGGYAFNHRWM